MQRLKRIKDSGYSVIPRDFLRMGLLALFMIPMIVCPSFLPAAPWLQNSSKDKSETTELTTEEREMIEDREILENLMLLQDLDAIDFLDILNEMEPDWSEGLDSNENKNSDESDGN